MNYLNQETTPMPIGIMAAMQEEIDTLMKELGADSEVVSDGRRTYHSGNLWGKPVVVVFSRWGKVAAATTATHLISHFGVSEILFTGVAGAAQPGLRVGDVVVGAQLWQHDMDARPLFGRHEIPLLGRTSLASDEKRRRQLLQAAAAFLRDDLPTAASEATRARFHIQSPRAVEGDIASGDKFLADRADLAKLLLRLPTIAAVDMESAAVAQVCYEYRIPFTVVRTISDAADESAAHDFPRFLTQVASAYSHGILKRLFDDRARSLACGTLGTAGAANLGRLAARLAASAKVCSTLPVSFPKTRAGRSIQTVKYVYWAEDGGWLGYLQEFPDDWTHGETREDLQEHLRDLYAGLSGSA
jgi:adenosylhomocysteine nucleosidase